MAQSSRLTKLLGLVGFLGLSLVLPIGTLHTLLYSALLYLFGRSLLPGREPLVTKFARNMRAGVLPEDLRRYTRRVTWAWALFCAIQLLISATLHGLAPREHWALFVNVLNFPLLAVMVIGEYSYRRLHFRHHTHVSPTAMLAAMRRPLGEWLK